MFGSIVILENSLPARSLVETYFLEFDGYRLIPEPPIPNAAIDYSAAINLLVLPTG